MRRFLLPCLALAFPLALAPACAKGADDGTTLGSDTAATNSDGGADSSTPLPGNVCNPPCPTGETCSANVCVPNSTDADHDGVTADKDCDDHDATVHPGATETCNGKDDNCDGIIDEGFDADGDGYTTCGSPTKKADCDDKDPKVNPGATETCNDKDDNCDTRIDEGFDADNDGYYACPHATIPADCNDGDPTMHPGAAETCDKKDNDCNGVADDIPALLSASLSPLDPHWAIAGEASASRAVGWILLTDDVLNQAGAGWWNASYLFDSFDVTATFWLQSKPVGADGISFAWVPGSDITKVGYNANNYGLVGLGGYGVVIDTYQNPGEPAAPFLAIVDGTTGTHLARATIPDVRNSANHTIRVQLDAGKVSVWVDAVNYIFQFPIAGYVPFSGHWGFTGSTGTVSTAQWVQAITMSFPKGQGCVP